MQTIPDTIRERLELAERNLAELNARATELTAELRNALADGLPTSVIAEKRQAVKFEIDEYELLVAELRARRPFEERDEILAEIEAAVARREQLNAEVRVAEVALQDALQRASECDDNLQRAKMAAGTSGFFTASQRLQRHREQFPDLYED